MIAWHFQDRNVAGKFRTWLSRVHLENRGLQQRYQDIWFYERFCIRQLYEKKISYQWPYKEVWLPKVSCRIINNRHSLQLFKHLLLQRPIGPRSQIETRACLDRAQARRPKLSHGVSRRPTKFTNDEPASTQVCHLYGLPQPSVVDVQSARHSSTKKWGRVQLSQGKEPTSGSDSSISVLSISMAFQTPIRARFFALNSTRALMLNSTVCFSSDWNLVTARKQTPLGST